MFMNDKHLVPFNTKLLFHFVNRETDEQSSYFCFTHVQPSTDGAVETHVPPQYLTPLLPPFLPIDVIMATN